MAVIHFTRKRDTKSLKQPILISKIIQVSSQIPWMELGQGVNMESTAGQSHKKCLQGILDLKRHFQENIRTGTEDVILNIYHG
jgi:hypothetical protein